MVACCLNQCGAKKNKDHPSLTLHKFPANEALRNKWLEIIGSKNINHRLKNWFVCSLHFHDSCFNRTLDVIRLRDGAVPSPSLLPEDTSRSESTFEVPISDANNLIKEENTESCLVEPQVADGTTANEAILHAKIHQQSKQIDYLTRRCKFLKRKVKCLNEKVRRCRKRIAHFSTIIKDLQKRKLVNTEESLILEECAGPEDFLRRHIAKSKGLPLKRKYSEQLRQFASTLHFFSPQAYDFIRKSYNTCLPHSRTLSKWCHKDAKPDFIKEAVDVLAGKVKENPNSVICASTPDEMAIEND